MIQAILVPSRFKVHFLYKNQMSITYSGKGVFLGVSYYQLFTFTESQRCFIRSLILESHTMAITFQKGIYSIDIYIYISILYIYCVYIYAYIHAQKAIPGECRLK